jgi:hypothetical protein
MAEPGSWLLNLVTETVLGSIADLSLGPLRAAARQIISAAVPRGLKPTEIMRDLTGANIYYGYQKMLSDIRSLSTVADNRAYMSTIPDDRLVAKSRMGEAELPRDADFLVTFEVAVTNDRTGVTTIENRSMYTNTRGTKDDYWGEFIDFISDFEYDDSMSYEYLGTESVVHNMGLPYGD